MAKRKPAPEPTEQALAGARTERDGLVARETALAVDLDAALVADDRIAVDKIEAAMADVRKLRERCERRIVLLEQKAAEELRERQERAQADLLARVEAKFRERDEATAEMCGHLGAAVVAFRKAVAAGGAAATGWPFSVTDAQAALFGRWFQRAIAYELYRLTGQPYTTAGASNGLEFPGAECPSVTDPRPEVVRPLTDLVAEASAYAIRRMRSAPMRVAAPVEPRKPAAPVEPRKPAPPVAEVTPIVAEAAAEPEPRRSPEYGFAVDLMNAGTGERKTVQILFTPDDVAESYADGVGPMGPLGRAIAARRAEERTDGFLFAGEPTSVRIDMNLLLASMGEPL